MLIVLWLLWLIVLLRRIVMKDWAVMGIVLVGIILLVILLVIWIIIILTVRIKLIRIRAWWWEPVWKGWSISGHFKDSCVRLCLSSQIGLRSHLVHSSITINVLTWRHEARTVEWMAIRPTVERTRRVSGVIILLKVVIVEVVQLNTLLPIWIRTHR